MELSEYLRLLLRSWAFILVWTLLGTVLAVAYLLTQPVQYTASSASYLSISTARDVDTLAQGSSFTRQAAIDFAQIADSPYVLNAVRRQLRLSTPLEDLEQQVQATVVTDSSIIRVTVTADSPSLASGIANAVTVQLAESVETLNPNAGNAASVARATTIARATPPARPSSPQVALDIAVGLLAGFALGVLLVLLRESLDQRIRTTTQLTRVSRAPLLGTVPLPALLAEGTLSNQKIAPFRSIRDEILEGPIPKHLVTISSVKAGESTAALAVTLAASVAVTRKSALVLDVTSRTEPAADHFGSGLRPGLTEVLDRTHTLQASLVPGPAEGLWYLPPGATTGREEDLIASLEMTELLEDLGRRFDSVIINTDPIADSSIARLVARQSDGVILACVLDRASAPEVRRAAESLERGGGRLLGTVLVTRPGRASRRRRPEQQPDRGSGPMRNGAKTDARP